MPERKLGRPPKYDWDQYFNGDYWVCYRGTDFETPPASFRALVHRTANSRGWKAETAIDKDRGSVSFRLYKED